MDVFIYLIPLTIVIVLPISIALLWSIKNNQYNDLKQKGDAILFSDERNKKL
jgi:cbb3-type cytochrome oxidase maturation protein